MQTPPQQTGLGRTERSGGATPRNAPRQSAPRVLACTYIQPRGRRCEPWPEACEEHQHYADENQTCLAMSGFEHSKTAEE